MIVKMKLGDLTARQMKRICDSFDCEACPLKIFGKKKECYLNFFCSPNADPDTEIEVSTDFMYPEQSEPFEKRMERLEKGMVRVWNETQINKCTISRLARVLGYKVGELHRLGGWHQIYESDYKCPADGKETADHEIEETTWQQNRVNLLTGKLGDPTKKETLIRYWELQRDAHYPFAQDQLDFMQGSAKEGNRAGDCVKFDDETFPQTGENEEARK